MLYQNVAIRPSASTLDIVPTFGFS